jgi:fatty acid desaturase
MSEVAVIEDPATAEASLDPMRARLPAELAEPDSVTPAARVALAWQRVTTTCARWSGTPWWSWWRNAARATSPNR